MSQTRVQLIGDSFDTGAIFDGTVSAIDVDISSNAVISGIATVGELLTPQIKTDVISNESGTGPIELKEGATLPISKTLSGAGDINITGNVTASEIQVNTISNESGTGPIELKEGAILPAGKTLSGDGDINISGNVTIGGLLTYEDVTNIDSVGLITARSGIDVTGGGLNVDGDIQKKGNTVPSAVIGISAPSNPSICDFWTDTSGEDPILKSWNGTEWIEVGSSTPSQFAPVINNVTLTENDPTGDRFTNQTFDVDINMLVEGAPHSQKGLKGEVTASFEVFPNTESVASNAITTFPNTNLTFGGGFAQFDGFGRAWAPNNLGVWNWYTLSYNSSYMDLYEGTELGQNINSGTYVGQASGVGWASFKALQYIPPSADNPYHTLVPYTNGTTVQGASNYWRRNANNSDTWTAVRMDNKGKVVYDEDSGKYFRVEDGNRNVYVQHGTNLYSLDQTTVYSNSDSNCQEIAVGNGIACTLVRHYSTGIPVVMVGTTDNPSPHGQFSFTTQNSNPKWIKFVHGYFWISNQGRLYRSADGQSWVDVTGIMVGNITNIHYNQPAGELQVYTSGGNSPNHYLNTYTSNNFGSTWVQSGTDTLSKEIQYMMTGEGNIVFYMFGSKHPYEYWFPYNAQTVTLSGTGADYSEFNVGDVVRPAGSTAQSDTGNLTAISGSDFSIISDYVYQAGDVVESIFPISSEVSSRYLVIGAAGVVTGTVGLDPGYVSVGPNTNQTLTFPSTFNTGNAPDDDLPAGTTLKVSAQATNSIGSSDFGPSNIITPA